MKYLLATLIIVAALRPSEPIWATIPDECFRPDGYADITRCYPECFNDEGLIDIRVCLPNDFGYIPPDLLWDGYIGYFGWEVPFLPSRRLDTFTPGYVLAGSLLRYDFGGMTGAVRSVADKFGLDPANYDGGIALDSCGYMGYTAWVTSPLIGENSLRLLVSDCRALIHKYEVACIHETVGEMPYEYFNLTKETGQLDEVVVYLEPPGELTKPDIQPGVQPIPYAETWLEEAGMSC